MSGVSWVVVWLVASLLALGYSVWALGDALVDRRFLRSYGLNGRREIVAASNIRRETLRVAVFADFTLLGLCALAHVLLVLVVPGLVLAVVLLAVGGVYERRDRVRLLGLGRSRALVALEDAEDREG